MASAPVAPGLTAFIALRIAQAIRLRVQKRVQCLLHRAPYQPVQVVLIRSSSIEMTLPKGLGVFSVMAAPSCCPGCVWQPPVQPDSGPPALLNCAKHSVRHLFGSPIKAVLTNFAYKRSESFLTSPISSSAAFPCP